MSVCVYVCQEVQINDFSIYLVTYNNYLPTSLTPNLIDVSHSYELLLFIKCKAILLLINIFV